MKELRNFETITSQQELDELQLNEYRNNRVCYDTTAPRLLVYKYLVQMFQTSCLEDI